MVKPFRFSVFFLPIFVRENLYNMKRFIIVILLLQFSNLIFSQVVITPDTVNSVPTYQLKPEDCYRGLCKPVVIESKFPNSLFVLQSDSLEAYESFNLSNGDYVSIRHWGCEYYQYTYRIETKRFNADTTDVAYWLDVSMKLLGELKVGIKSPVNFDNAIACVKLRYQRAFVEKSDHYHFTDPLYYGKGETRDAISIDRVEKLGDKGYAIEITFINLVEKK